MWVHYDTLLPSCAKEHTFGKFYIRLFMHWLSYYLTVSVWQLHIDFPLSNRLSGNSLDEYSEELSNHFQFSKNVRACHMQALWPLQSCGDGLGRGDTHLYTVSSQRKGWWGVWPIFKKETQNSVNWGCSRISRGLSMSGLCIILRSSYLILRNIGSHFPLSFLKVLTFKFIYFWLQWQHAEIPWYVGPGIEPMP